MQQQQRNTSQMVDEIIKAQGDWQGKTLSHLRALIRKADPIIVEER